MRPSYVDLPVVQGTTGAGAAQQVQNLVDKWVQVAGIAGGCVLQVQGSIDGTNYSQSGANITADGTYPVDEAFDRVRINRSAAGTGNPTARLLGRDAATS
jgi:hypothetical protein